MAKTGRKIMTDLLLMEKKYKSLFRVQLRASQKVENYKKKIERIAVSFSKGEYPLYQEKVNKLISRL